MRANDTRNIKNVTVMGLGLFGGGVGVAEYWAKKGVNVTVTDLRDRETLAPSIAALAEYHNIEYILEEHRELDFTCCDLLIVNPAVKPGNKYVELAKEAHIPITTEIGLFIAEHQKTKDNKILAVTGSNGKSTTTSLLSSILHELTPQTLSGGNIGGSLLSTLGTYSEATPAILELSSFQLHYLYPECFAPDIAVITNLAPNHLDWHKTLENYYTDKKNILAYQDKSAHCVLNYRDPVLKQWASTIQAKVMFTSLKDSKQENAAFINGGEFIIRDDGNENIIAKLSSLKLPGSHNQENALQALAAAYIYSKRHTNKVETTTAKIDKGLANFTGLAHRQELVAEISGVSFINDSIATTPESTIAALNSYEEREIVIIAGGYDKDIPLANMCKEITRKASSAVLIGQTAQKIYTEIKRFSKDFDAIIIDSNDFPEAIETAYQRISKGVVLLSPGCASYGMFINFQERGDEFKSITTVLEPKISDQGIINH